MAEEWEPAGVTLDEHLVDGGAVVEPLAEEFDLVEVALAAVKLAHEPNGAAADEEDIPEVSPVAPNDRGGRDSRRPRSPREGMTRLYVGTGRSAGIRTQDLVGAIAGESRITGRDIGAIEIADRFSLVEVPESAADEVIAALKGSSIKGRRATVRRERYQAKPRKRRD